MGTRVLRWLGMAALLAGYPLLVHYTNIATPPGQPNHLGALVSITPLFGIAAWLAWRSAQRQLALAAIVLCVAALGWGWPLLLAHHGVVYWLQHVGMQLILLVFFGRTLLPGKEPLCTRFARTVHAPLVLTPCHERYTRNVTLAWTVFFAVIALVSTLLFFLSPLDVWSAFANFATFPLVVLMFVAEYKVRGWVLPHVPPVHILDGVRAFMASAERRT